MTPAQQQAVIAEAMTWLRTPYHHAEGIKGVGVDCAFLLVRVFHACGLIPDIDPRPYPMDWHLHRGEQKYLGWVERYADRVDTPEPGDIVLYQFGRCVSHGGIVLDWPRIIHSQRDTGCVLAESDSGDLGSRIAGFWRLRAVQ